MSLKRLRRVAINLGPRNRLFLLIATALLSFLVWFAPKDLIIQGRSRPVYRVDNTPRFLYGSHFRDRPDLRYEKRISDALQEIERATLAENGGETLAEDRIWQIALHVAERKSDSVAFEDKNNEWEYSLVTEDEATELVARLFPSVPEVRDTYNSYPYDILRADLLRYLLLWYFGGFYADMDVYPARAIRSCPALAPVFADEAAKNSTISLVVGVELDEPYASPHLMRDWHWTRGYGILQYTLYAPRRFSPILREAIVRVLSHTRQRGARLGGHFGGLLYDQRTVLEVSGPSLFTDTVLDTLSLALPPTHRLVNQSVAADKAIGDLVSQSSGEKQRRVTWAPLHKIREPLCVDDSEAVREGSLGGVCFLPISAWGNGQRHSGAEGFDGPHACVNHRFAGTWKRGSWWSSFW